MPEPGRINQFIGSAHPDGFSEVHSFISDVLDIAPKTVCGRCNSGWMSQIENSAQKYLTPLVSGSPTRLGGEAQRAIATWSALKAIVASSITRTKPSLDREWIEWMFVHRQTPPAWQVLLSAYVGTRIAFFECRDADHGFYMDGSKEENPRGVIFTMLVGSLLV
jgi:hypothetical protein